MLTRTWQNNPSAPDVKSFRYNPLQWAQDFELELLESNREVFLRIYNTDVDEYWLESAND